MITLGIQVDLKEITGDNVAINITFHNETQEDVEIYQSVIKEVVAEAVKIEGLTGKLSCNYIFVDNDSIKQLNSYYRGKNYPTDVLTFAAEDLIFTGCKNLGDVFISVEKVLEQAYAYGHGEVREISFLAIHGFLHLLGYDHLDEATEKEMFAKQEAILDAKNIRR